MNTIGTNIKLTIFGESHQKAIGAVIDGLPSNYPIPFELIQKELLRRRPKKDISTPRVEEDKVEFLSGVKDGKTDGSPLAFYIENKNIKSEDYKPGVLRPGHADLGAYLKYKENYDYRGGGQFSGRVTASLVVAGAIFKDILQKRGTKIISHISSIGNIDDDRFDFNNLDARYNELESKELPVINDLIGKEMREQILKTKEEQDSLGGSVETVILNVEPGLGEPFFLSIESYISSLVFSLGGVKGITFGENNDIYRKKGSEVNDAYYLQDNKIITKTHNNGGISGGISIATPIIFKTYIKPTPSIGKPQQSVNILHGEETLELKGRHDPCIVMRILPVIEAVTAFALLDLLCHKNGIEGLLK